MSIIGRLYEQQILQDCLESKESEFLIVYGRRRVGKTYLIKEYFDNRFSFYATGVDNVRMAEELEYFSDSLAEYGSTGNSRISTWREAFSRLKKLLMSDNVIRDPITNKRIIFLDELPWMDTPKSSFRPALDHFWNSRASSQKDIILIVCGSATSWIINNILSDKGGLYNRVTRQIHLKPFTLGECEKYFKSKDINMSREDIITCYMIFGGIPYYLGLLSRRMSLAQNIDSLLFNEIGQLHYEYNRLFKSLFRNAEKHYTIIKVLTEKRSGMTRKEIIEKTNIGDGKLLTKALEELEQCGFIRKYKNISKDKKNAIFQIIDPFVLFCHIYLENKKIYSKTKKAIHPTMICFNGLSHNTYNSIIVSEINGEDLFS